MPSKSGSPLDDRMTSPVEVTSSSHDLFTAAVRDALPRLRFYPATSGTRKVPAAGIMPFHFTLK